MFLSLNKLKLNNVNTIYNKSFNCYQRFFCSNVKTKLSTSSSSINSEDNLPNKTSFSSIRTNLQNSKIIHKSVQYGQPTFHTHPHLIKENELCPEIPLREFQLRRHILMENIQKFSMNTNTNLKNHIVIIPSAVKKYMSDKIPYVFRQNTDFFYLTGCLEPDSILVMWIDQAENPKSILFVRPKNENAELWDGARTGVERSIEMFGVDESYSINEFGNYLNRYMKLYQSFSCWYNDKESDQQNLTEIIQSHLKHITLNTFESPTIFIHRQRLIKSPNEINLMKITCDIASKSINQTIKESKPGDSEHNIFARIDYHCRMNNADYLAYPPVVASGKNATTIHYISNSQIINDGDLVLLDAGCEYGGYTSDITRTWAINGKFSPSQQILYEILSSIQKELLTILLQDGGKTLDTLFDTMCTKIGCYLQEIGIISNKLSGLELARKAFSFCPHHVSHYLGMDVHDTPLISRNIYLLPGMVFTVEPGIYIPLTCKDCPEEFRGIGMRIEDDVYVTPKNTIEILTDKCIKDSNELESLILLK